MGRWGIQGGLTASDKAARRPRRNALRMAGSIDAGEMHYLATHHEGQAAGGGVCECQRRPHAQLLTRARSMIMITIRHGRRLG